MEWDSENLTCCFTLPHRTGASAQMGVATCNWTLSVIRTVVLSGRPEKTPTDAVICPKKRGGRTILQALRFRPVQMLFDLCLSSVGTLSGESMARRLRAVALTFKHLCCRD